MTGDDRANRNPVEWRTDRTDGIAHVFDRMAAAAAVLDEHRLAAARIAADLDYRMLAHPRTLLNILIGDADQRDEKDHTREDREEDLSGD